MGIVEELGEEVTSLKKGDRVVMPFNVADGRCRNCEEGKTAFCTDMLTPDSPVARMATSLWGLIVEAQYIRVPFADFNALKLPPGKEHEADFVLLAGESSTPLYYNHGVEISGFRSGESIAVFGAGPVGLMAAYSASLRGASNIYVVDRVPERLAAAQKFGCIPIDFTKGDPVDQIISHTGGEVDRSVDAIGYQAVDSSGSSEKANIILENMIRVTRACGGMGIPGLYVPSDPGAADTASANGMISLSFGKLFENASGSLLYIEAVNVANLLQGLSLSTGQCNVKAYDRYLRDMIIAGKAKPSFV
ncbi:hypothetical protein N7536_004719 [Penicillium majusculum]|nr:hypothetical protein N7536_004719 [Penicillium majusculum]